MISHETYMHRCLQIAKLGLGNVAPNPMVGAVIVYNDSIIGEGYHQQYGEPHAEVNAFNSVKDKSLLKESTIYVSLEPCAHFGKTPPCANLIVKHQFKKVVIGSRDPHSKVDGKGILILKENNIEVISGVLEKECNELNKRFFTFHKKKRPFVVVKWAETQNGKIDNGGNKNEITWISCPETQVFVHQIRKENQAILVGRKTIENDNPSLTLRRLKGRNPVRVIIDPNCALPMTKTIFDDQSKTIIINVVKNEVNKNIEWIKINSINSTKILDILFQKNIDSVLIEGGGKTLQSFINDNNWDEAHRIVGENSFKKGTNAPSISCSPTEITSFFTDTINFYLNK